MGPANRLVIYLSASLANGPLNTRLRHALPESAFELVLPQEFAPVHSAHPEYPRAIYQRCIDEMERCDAGLLLLDAFGVDCASEAGWLCARGTPLVGLAGGSLRFLQNWMVKGNLSSIITTDVDVAAAVASDPILGGIPRRHVDAWPNIAGALAALVEESRALRPKREVSG